MTILSSLSRKCIRKVGDSSMGCVENILYNIEVNNFEKAMELILANVEEHKDDILFLKAEAKLCIKAI